MMKAKLYTLCTAALLLAACTNDPMEDIVSPGTETPSLTDVPEGSYVIDYTPATDAPGTRADGDGPIQSLDYLLYASTDGTEGSYTLTKRRPIPDINLSTTWPLTRERMTWAQRQALKDTLETGKFYKAVFVANAADWLWDNNANTGAPTANEDLSTTSSIVLQNANLDGSTTAPNFNDARLLLPTAEQGSFNESNMYYLWTGDIKPTESHYDKNHPAQMSIVLQRMINKVEIRLEETVTKGIAEKESVEAYVEGELEAFYNEHYTSTEDENSANWGEIGKPIASYLTNKANSITRVGTYNEKDCKEAFKNNWLGNIDKQRLVVADIISCSEDKPCTSEAPCAKHWFIEQTKDDFITRCDWSTVQSIEVIYDKANFPQAIGFNKQYKAESTEDSPTLTVERSADNRFIFYTYGYNANETTNPNLATIQSLKFKNNIGTEIFSANCSIIPGKDANLTGGNRSIYISYNPMAELSLSETDKPTYTRTYYDLQEAMDWNWAEGNAGCDFNYGNGVAIGEWHEKDMKDWVNNTVFASDATTPETTSDDGFRLITLTLENIPLVDFEDVWTTQDATAIDTQVLSEPVEP